MGVRTRTRSHFCGNQNFNRIKLISFHSDRSQKKLKKKDEALLAALKEAGVEGYEIPKSVGKPTLDKKEKNESNEPKSKKRTFAEAHPEEPEAKK